MTAETTKHVMSQETASHQFTHALRSYLLLISLLTTLLLASQVLHCTQDNEEGIQHKTYVVLMLSSHAKNSISEDD